MDFRKRHDELLHKVRTGIPMTRDEMLELERLGKALAEADQDGQVQAAKNENQRLVLQAQRDFAFRQIFATVVNGYQAIDNEANRLEISSWVHPGEQIDNPQEWFARVLRESPSLGGKLSWTKYLTPAQKKAQAQADEKVLRVRFAQVARTHGIAENEGNFEIWSSVSNPIVTEQFPGKPYIYDYDRELELYLTPAGQAEEAKWAQERLEQKQRAFEQRQRALVELRDSDSPEAFTRLRQMAAQEAEAKAQRQLTATQQQQLEELRYRYQQDSLAGYRTPLPASITKEQIYKWDANEMRRQMSRYGASRITARLRGLTEISDGHGGIIHFEEQ